MCSVAQLYLTFCNPINCSPPGFTRRRQWHPSPVLLPGKSHGWRSLVGCSPWGREESDTTERLPFHFSLSCIGEGNGNPLQCSCLENPRDGGSWWAAIYGVAQSRTRLKQLSSSRLHCPWDFPGTNNEVGYHLLLQGIFLAHGLNPYVLHWHVNPLPLRYLGSPGFHCTKHQIEKLCW